LFDKYDQILFFVDFLINQFVVDVLFLYNLNKVNDEIELIYGDDHDELMVIINEMMDLFEEDDNNHILLKEKTIFGISLLKIIYLV
jgi:hypothetical protein